jgi:hypothetical protein
MQRTFLCYNLYPFNQFIQETKMHKVKYLSILPIFLISMAQAKEMTICNIGIDYTPNPKPYTKDTVVPYKKVPLEEFEITKECKNSKSAERVIICGLSWFHDGKDIVTNLKAPTLKNGEVVSNEAIDPTADDPSGLRMIKIFYRDQGKDKLSRTTIVIGTAPPHQKKWESLVLVSSDVDKKNYHGMASCSKTDLNERTDEQIQTLKQEYLTKKVDIDWKVFFKTDSDSDNHNDSKR